MALPQSGKVLFSKAEFDQMVAEHRDLQTAIGKKYGRLATRVELRGGNYEVDYEPLPEIYHGTYGFKGD